MSKKIGIVCAMSEEAEALFKAIGNEHGVFRKVSEVAGMKLTHIITSVDGAEIIIAESGIGKVSSAKAATFLIGCKCETIIMCGVAGALSSSMIVGDVIITDKTIQADVDLTAFGRKIGEINGHEQVCNPSPISYNHKSGFLGNIWAKLMLKGSDMDIEVHLGVALSCDQFTGLEGKKEYRKIVYEASGSQMNASIDMESAAVNAVCRDFDIPCLIVRGISDTLLSEASKEEFEENLLISATNAGIIASTAIAQLI